MTATSTVLVAGETLAGYRIEDVIGWGGMAVVYRAEQISLGRRVALKVLAPQLSRDEAFRERFRREGKHAAALDHPHVVTIFDSGDDGGRLYMAMRLVEGTTLAERMSAEGLSAQEALALLAPIADALDAAHRLGLVHRDIKPQNILIGRDGHPYLADFGVAKTTTATSGLTAAGGFVGSVHYASPEQITGGPTTAAGDVYALTAVLYQCLTGQVPYPRDTEAGVMHAHVHDPPPTLAPLSPGAEALDLVIARGMAKEAADRYRRASELMAEASAAIDALPASRRRSVPAFAPPVGAGGSPSTRPRDGQAAPIRPAIRESAATRIDGVGRGEPLTPRTVAGGSRGTGRRGSRRAVSELTTADQRRDPVIAEPAKPTGRGNRRAARAMLATAAVGLVLAAGAAVVLSGVLNSPAKPAKPASGPGAKTPAIADTRSATAAATTGTTSGATTGTAPVTNTGTGSVAATTGGTSGHSGPAGTYTLVAGVTGPVIVRAGPSTHARMVAKIASSARVAIVCTATGQPQARGGGATDTTWDRIAQPAGFVSDTLVSTGSQAVARPCTASDSPGTGRAVAKPKQAGGTPTPNPPPPPAQQGGGSSGPTPPAPGGVAGMASQFRRFSIQRPGGDWVLEHSEVSRAGYVDTRWHLRGSPDVVFVVDYTDGFYGDEVAAANSVRQLYSNVSTYQQLNFAPVNLGAAVARRWEYIDGGEHSVDIFVVACNTSFAIRGGTPVDGWSSDYNNVFYNAAASLKPSC